MNLRGAFDDTIRLAERLGLPDWPGTNMGMEHLRLMRSSIRAQFSDAQIALWLGWAQCLVCFQTMATLEDMNAINAGRRNDET